MPDRLMTVPELEARAREQFGLAQPTAMLTREQVGMIRDGLTMGDLEAAREQGIDSSQPEQLARFALHRRAQRLGLIGSDVDVLGFLDLVLVTDLAWAYSDEVRNPLSVAPASSAESPEPTGSP